MPLAELGLEIRSEQARQGAADLEKLTAASQKAETAAERLGRASAKANADMAKISAAVTQANASLDKLVAEAGQGNAAFQKLIATVEQTNAAIAKLGQAVPPKLPNPKPFNEGLGDTVKIGKQTQQMFLNLSRQGNDLATMWMMGAAPMQIFASQAGQVYDALESGPGGLRGSLRAIGESLLSVASRFPLVTAAAAAAGAAFVIYKTASGDKVEELDKILGDHRKIIEGLGDGWDKAASGAKNYVRESTEAANLALSANAKEAAKRAATDVADAVMQIQAAIFAEGSKTGGMMLASRFSPFYELIDRLRDGKVTVTEFRTELGRMSEADASLKPVAEELSQFTKNAKDTEIAVAGMRKEITAAEANALAFQDALARIDSDPIRKALQEIFDKASEGKAPIGDIMIELAKLERANPTFAGIIAGFKSLIDQAAATDAALDALGQKYFASMGGSPNGRHRPEVYLPDTAPTPDARPSVEDFYARRDKALARAARAPNPYRDLIKNADDRIAQMRTELDLMGKVGVEADTLRHFQELLAKATDHGRKIGEGQRKELHDRAEAMAKLEDATKKAKLMQDLLFDRSQMLRSSTDQIIADTMRGAGLKVDFNSPIAGAIRFNEQLSQTRELLDGIGQDISSGLSQALEDGKLEWKELGQIALDALNRIADKLIQIAMDQMVTGILGSLFGGLGGGGSSAVVGGSLIQDVFASAKGNVFSGPGIGAYANQIVTKPTIFPFAKGIGLMGEEAGSPGEAIMPLRRTASGHLGVMAVGDSQRSADDQNISVSFAPNITVQNGGDNAGEQVTEALKKFEKEFTPRVVKSLREAKTRGMI